jgi:hypothetical protein
MHKQIIVFIIVLSLLLVSVVYADDLETISFVSPSRSDWTITIKGNFSKPGLVSSGGTLFSVFEKAQGRFSYNSFDYLFTGRTGEKTFEIQYKCKTSSTRYDDKKINMYLDDNLYHLSFFPFSGPIYSNCTKDDKVYLKKIQLQGNQLEYQIILPDCLKSK